MYSCFDPNVDMSKSLLVKEAPSDCDNMDKIHDSHLQFLTQNWQLTTPYAKASDIAVLHIWSLFSAVVTTVSSYELCQR